MQRIRVGEPFHSGVAGYEEAVHYNYTPGGHTLILSRNDPGLAEIYDIRKGQTTFALGLAEEVLFLFGRFGDQPWQVAHYNWWINPPVMRPDPMDDLDCLSGRFSVNVCLINASNGLVAALRSVQLSDDFARCLLGKVEQQIHRPFNLVHYLEVVEKTRCKYADETSIMSDAICVCVNGGSLVGHSVCSDFSRMSENRWH